MKKTESQFTLERQVLDGALARGGADVEFPTHGKAVAFRQRCYTYRKWKREMLGEASPYEKLVIKDLGKEGKIVQVRGRELDAKVTFLNGPPLAPDPIEIPDDALMEEAEEMARRLVGRIEL